MFVDIFLARVPMGEVQVQIQNTGYYDITIADADAYYNKLSCSVTIYFPDQPPLSYFGSQWVDVFLEAGEVRTYTAFPQASRPAGEMDFTNGWGDVNCYLFQQDSVFRKYSKRLP